MKRKDIDTVQVPRDVCEYVADNIGTYWKRLGRKFDISEAHLQNIDDENRSVYERTMAVFNRWTGKAGEKATVGVLRRALEKIEKRDLSDKVRGMDISTCFTLQLQIQKVNVVGQIIEV